MNKSEKTRQHRIIAAVLVGLGLFAIYLVASVAWASFHPTEPTYTTHPAGYVPNSGPVNSAPSPSVSSEPVVLSGSGKKATDKFTLTAGLATATYKFSGANYYFGAQLLDSEGKLISLIANEASSSGEGSIAFSVPSTGTYLVDVSSGTWEITIQQ